MFCYWAHNFEKIEFSDVNSFFILREGGVSFGRFVASTIIMLQLGTYVGLLEILVFKTASRGGNADLDHFRLSVGILLLLVLPFQGSTFLKAVNTIQALDRGYARAIYDLTICLVQSLGLYLLSQSAQSLPARCSKQLKSGNKMYYGIEIGPYGPTPQQSEDIRNAVWKDNLYKELRKYVQDLEKDYVEMVGLVDQVNEAQTKEMPKKYDKDEAKKATHLYRLCGT